MTITQQKENGKITPEQIENEFPLFMEDLRWQLISGKFVKDNNIQVNPDEIQNAAKEFTRMQLAQYGMMNAEDKLVDQWDLGGDGKQYWVKHDKKWMRK